MNASPSAATVSAAQVRSGRNYPAAAWYVAASSIDVRHELLPRRVRDLPVVLFRTEAGQAVALEDRCVHRSYPLSLGQLIGDTIVAGYHGFEYGPDGRCVRVPSQANVPIGAQVRVLPVHEDDHYVWVWTAQPALAALRPAPRLPWESSGYGWAVVGGELEVAANYLAVHEALADATHLPAVDPDVAPPVLGHEPPPLKFELSETTVSFSRTFPAAPVPDWHAHAIGLDPAGAYEQNEAGSFAGPGLWLDEWNVHADGAVHSMQFATALTPVDPIHTRVSWRVARNFKIDSAAVGDTLRLAFTRYYRRLGDVLEVIQSVHDRDGYHPEVNVRADIAALHVRKIVQALLAEDSVIHPRRNIRPAAAAN